MLYFHSLSKFTHNMKTKVLLSFLTCIVISSFIGIWAQTTAPATANQDKQTAQSDTSYTQQEMAEARELMLTVPELRLLSPEVKAQRKASIILSEYTELSDSQYKITISEAEAAKLGVAPELNRKCVADVERTNKMVAEMIKEGKKIDLPDIQAIIKAYKRGELSLPIVL